jgi:two-component system sensor histidine kinase ChvG
MLVTGLRELVHVDNRLERGRAERFDLSDLARSTAAGLSASGRAAVTVDVRPSGRTYEVSGDRDALVQVFENVIGNALSFAPSDSIVEATVIEDAGACRVIVEDRGPGLPASHVDRVFERFFSYRPAGARGEHLGLGLAIARRIVEAHGGRITAANRSGGGAVFEIRLPT